MTSSVSVSSSSMSSPLHSPAVLVEISLLGEDAVHIGINCSINTSYKPNVKDILLDDAWSSLPCVYWSSGVQWLNVESVLSRDHCTIELVSPNISPHSTTRLK